jgi:hypothetical protein
VPVSGGLFVSLFRAGVAVTFPSPMALGLRSALEQLAAVGKTSSPFGAEVNDCNLVVTRTAAQVFI